MAAEIERETGLTSTLHQSSGGVFEVDFHEDRIYSKQKTGRFPDYGEVLNLLKDRLPTS